MNLEPQQKIFEKYSNSQSEFRNCSTNDRYNRKGNSSSLSTREFSSPKKINDLSSLSPIFPSSAIKSSLLDDSFEFSKERPDLFTERTFHNPNSNSIDLTLGRSKNSYESQIKYMQEYIIFLERKARLNKNFENLEEEFEITTDQASYNLALKAEIDYLKQTLWRKDKELRNCLDELCDKENQIKSLSSRFDKNCEKNIKRNSHEGKEAKKILGKQIYDLEFENMKNKMEIKSKNREIEYLKTEIKTFESDNYTKSLKKISGNLEKTVHNAFEVYEIEIQRMNEKIGIFEKKIFDSMNTVRVIQNLAEFKNDKFLALKKQLYEKCEGRIREKENTIDKMAELIENLKLEKAKIEKNFLELEKKTMKKEFSDDSFQNILEDLNQQLENAVCIKNNLELENKFLNKEVASHKEKIAEKDLELTKKNLELAESKEEIIKKTAELSEKTALIESFYIKINDLKNSEKLMQELFNQKLKMSEANENLQKACISTEKNIIEKSESIEELKKNLAEKVKKIEKLNKITLEQEFEMKKLYQNSCHNKTELLKLQKENQDLKTELLEKNSKFENFEDFSKIILDKDQKIKELKVLLSQTNSEIKAKNEFIHKFKSIEKEFNQDVFELEKIAAEKQESLLKLEKKSKKLEEKIKEQEKIINDKGENIKELKESCIDLEIQLKNFKITKNSEIDELEKAISEKNKKICELSNKLKIIKSQSFDFHEKNLKNLQSENSWTNKELKEAIEKAKNKEFLLKKEISQLNQIIENFETSSLYEENDSLKQKIEETEKKIRADRLAQENQIKNLEKENRILADTVENLYYEIENNKEKEFYIVKNKDICLEDLEVQIENYKKLVQTLKNENLANNKNEEKLVQELAELKLKVTQVQKYAVQLEKEKSLYFSALEEAQENLKKSPKTEKKNFLIEKKLEKENSEILIRKKELELKANQLEEQLFEANKENEALKTKILETQENVLNSDNQPIVQGLEKNIENLNETIKNLYFENEKQKKTFADAQKNQENRYKELMNQAERLNSELERLKSEINDKDSIISELQSSKSVLEETYNNLIQSFKENKQNDSFLSEKIVSQKAKYEGKLKEMNEQIDEMNTKAVNQCNENKENQRNLNKATVEIKNLKKSCDELSLKNQKLAAELLKNCQENDQFKNLLKELEAENKKMKNLISELKTKINDLNIQNSYTEKNYQESLKTCEDIEKSAKMKKKCEKDDFELLRQENHKLQKSLSDYAIQIKDLETQLSYSQSSASALTNELRSQKETLTNCENTHKTLSEIQEKLCIAEGTILKLREDKAELNKFLNTLQINMKADKKFADEQIFEKEKNIALQSNDLKQANDDIHTLKKQLKDKNDLMNIKIIELKQIKTELQALKLEKNSLESSLTREIFELKQKIKTLEDSNTEISDQNLKLSEEIVKLDECNRKLSIENEKLSNENFYNRKSDGLVSNKSESCFDEDIEDYSNEKLAGTLKKAKSAKIRQKYDFDAIIAEKDKKIVNLEEKLEVLQKKLEEGSLAIEKLPKTTSKTYEGREQLRKLLVKISNFK